MSHYPWWRGAVIYQIYPRSYLDANGDGVLTEADVKAIADHIMGQTPEGFNLKNADVNGDGFINAADIVELVNKIK